MKHQKGYTAVELTVVVFILTCIGSWIANVVKLVEIVSDPLSGMFILRAIGVFVPPFGAIMGFL